MNPDRRQWFPTFRRILGIQMPFSFLGPWRSRRGQSRSLLRLLAIAGEEHLALAPLLRAWAADERAVQRARVTRLAELVEQGTPLVAAVEQVPGALRDEDVLAIRFGVHSGMFAGTIRQTLEEPGDVRLPRRWRFDATLRYVLAVCCVAVLTWVFLLLKIFPVIDAIFGDFGLEKPTALRALERMSGLLARFWWLATAAALLVLWSTFSSRPGRFLRYLFPAGRFQPLEQSRAAEVLRKLGLAADAGRPLTGALSTLARYHHEASMRHKLLFVRNEVEQGVEIWQSLADARLLTPVEARLMGSAERVGNSSWVLRQLAAVKKARTERRMRQWSELFLPAALLLLGCFVLLVSLAIFLTLARLLEGLL